MLSTPPPPPSPSLCSPCSTLVLVLTLQSGLPLTRYPFFPFQSAHFLASLVLLPVSPVTKIPLWKNFFPLASWRATATPGGFFPKKSPVHQRPCSNQVTLSSSSGQVQIPHALSCHLAPLRSSLSGLLTSVCSALPPPTWTRS